MAVRAKNKCGATLKALFWLVVHLCVASVSGLARFKCMIMYMSIPGLRGSKIVQRKRRSSGKLGDCFNSCFNFFYCYTKVSSELFL